MGSVTLTILLLTVGLCTFLCWRHVLRLANGMRRGEYRDGDDVDILGAPPRFPVDDEIHRPLTAEKSLHVSRNVNA